MKTYKTERWLARHTKDCHPKEDDEQFEIIKRQEESMVYGI